MIAVVAEIVGREAHMPSGSIVTKSSQRLRTYQATLSDEDTKAPSKDYIGFLEVPVEFLDVELIFRTLPMKLSKIGA